ncbi:hypothetical protein Sa4125_34710 [Aureimonas sp. SA4125]|uniref:flagellar hook-length control protein FliK n=1 Tax=Aureimonas sp. SA4125 TaxID=2826993 RepID=UPI001CC723C1|nr:flagellar hook-length control protein FliK [Aureimonas sp. SA4125]BDA85929.1 hypothetical protein Sa4125_34710 [Aureimonas sp. SA4125]
MRISASPPSFIESGPAASVGSSDGEYSRLFDKAVRDVAKETSTRKNFLNEERAAGQSADDKAADADTNGKIARSAAQHQTKAVMEKAAPAAAADARGESARQDVAADSADAESDRLTTIDALGRLLGGDFSAAASPTTAESIASASSDGAASSDSVASQARPAVVTPGVDGFELAGNVADVADKARGKVSLEVVHMETHFEPRSDAFVLVEGETPAAVAAETRIDADAKSRRLPVPDAGTAASAVSKLPIASDAPVRNVAPRTDAPAVLQMRAAIDGQIKDARQLAAAAGAARTDGVEPADADQPRLSFEEALARLGDPRGSDAASVDEDTRRDRGAQFSARADGQARGVNENIARGTISAPSGKADEGAPAALFFPSMTGQVASRVIDALGSGLTSARAPDAAPGNAYVRLTAGGAALKTLTIQLQPEELGRLDVTMRLVEGQLTLEIAATEAGTAKVLAEDREGLRKLLQHAGFSLDDTSITIVSRDVGATQARTAPTEASAQNGSRTGSDAGSQADDGASAHSGGGRDNSGNGDDRQNARRQSAADRASASLKAASTYL